MHWETAVPVHHCIMAIFFKGYCILSKWSVLEFNSSSYLTHTFWVIQKATVHVEVEDQEGLIVWSKSFLSLDPNVWLLISDRLCKPPLSFWRQKRNLLLSSVGQNAVLQLFLPPAPKGGINITNITSRETKKMVDILQFFTVALVHFLDHNWNSVKY